MTQTQWEYARVLSYATFETVANREPTTEVQRLDLYVQLPSSKYEVPVESADTAADQTFSLLSELGQQGWEMISHHNQEVIERLSPSVATGRTNNDWWFKRPMA